MPTTDAIARSAFITRFDTPMTKGRVGPLSGLSFVAKDLFDIEGHVTACGNVDRARDGKPSLSTAPSVLTALMSGASLIGKTHTDELACGMFGMNPAFGTPINPAAPDRAPGGSSSGSAAAVGAGIADFGIGSDTGGSIRVPASFCGLYGLRTTFGRISTAGVMAMAPSFDTVGWLARDASMLARVGEAYFGAFSRDRAAPRLMIARDAFDIPVNGIGETLLRAAQMLGPAQDITLYQEGVEHWLDTFRPLQLHDLWATLGNWCMEPGRALSESVDQRINLSRTVDPEAHAKAVVNREHLTTRLLDLLGDDGMIVIPTAHDLPPFLDADVSAQIVFREKTLALTCVASLCRLPQIAIPAATVDHCPVGLSVIAGHRGEERLLAFAEALGPLVERS
ncbi:amidase [Martelella sp. HB161492]|uniref:amidase n=1 Tax=Martelella sp. HB161492 TaxID=2720726 RepID=UPI00159201EA|nr:amidase [Martelella sp. HB161492]